MSPGKNLSLLSDTDEKHPDINENKSHRLPDLLLQTFSHRSAFRINLTDAFMFTVLGQTPMWAKRVMDGDSLLIW